MLSLTRQALGLQTVPPNQVLAGLALFISLFIMGPTISQMNQEGGPALPERHNMDGRRRLQGRRQVPFKTWMLKQTRQSELKVFIERLGRTKDPRTRPTSWMATLIPAFILSELRRPSSSGS